VDRVGRKEDILMPKKMTKERLLRLAVAKVNRLTEDELHNFVFNINCCPHKKTHPVGMDSSCDDCGAWV
jgi:hypothetical protein